MIEIIRDEREAERGLSNALYHLGEAAVTLRQHMPKRGEARALWLHQLKKLKMARGIIANIRELVEHDDRFRNLQRHVR